MNRIHEKIALPVIVSVAAFCASAAVAKDAIRYKSPKPDAPMAQAVEVPAGQGIVYLSGAVPDITDKDASKESAQAFGDAKTQTVSVLNKIEIILKSMGLTLQDVVKMQVFLVGDGQHEGKMDFAGFMEGYHQFFGTKEQPNLPARSVVKVAGLANPGWLVEIEATAMRR